MWFTHPDFTSDYWSALVIGSPDFIYPFKLKRLKEAIKLWNQSVFGNVNSRLKQAQLHMEVALRNSDEDPSDIEKFNVVKDATVKVQDIRMQQNIMLTQKSRNKWLLEGSSNFSFFHNSVQTRRCHNTISKLVAEDGTTITEAVQLRDHVVSYYEAKFNGDDLPIEKGIFNYDHPSITAEECVCIDLVPSYEEIKQAVFDLDADSAPGPDVTAP
ncbi:uncharacterized protein LOC113295559 [Papaver somniferum]|uniref:uncharacterized protein LOC113295559 n=1 Tax=Papaver somniferum TaxID=3469 RepID=UPI000E6F90B4|nr:uncharacterized protein LOC113295559 [Papaver somniferum]